MKKELYTIIEGKHKGRDGYIDDSMLEKTGNVMFYTIEKKNPYRICKKFSEIERKYKNE